MPGDQLKRPFDDGAADSNRKSSRKNGHEYNELRREGKSTRISPFDYSRLDAKLTQLEEIVKQRVAEKNRQDLHREEKISDRRQRPVDQFSDTDMQEAAGLLRGFIDVDSILEGRSSASSASSDRSKRLMRPVEQPHSQQGDKTPQSLTRQEEENAAGLLSGFLDF